jgi:hypothetical protein
MSSTIGTAHGLMKWKAFVWLRTIDLCADDTAEKASVTSKTACKVVVHNVVLVAVVRFEEGG